VTAIYSRSITSTSAGYTDLMNGAPTGNDVCGSNGHVTDDVTLP